MYLFFQERDFDKHVNYCQTEPEAQDFLECNYQVRDYFEVCIIYILLMCKKYCYMLLNIPQLLYVYVNMYSLFL
jgi:hypothetical protein